MQTKLRLNTRVQAGHKLEIVASELVEGEEVTVTVTRHPISSSDRLQPTPPEERVAFAQFLLEQGVISSIPTGRNGSQPRPVPVRGRPVSETIIEERG